MCANYNNDFISQQNVLTILTTQKGIKGYKKSRIENLHTQKRDNINVHNKNCYKKCN